jgi:hypothetical protein
MSKGKSSISKKDSYLEIGEFWDTHDLSEYWDQTKAVRAEVDIQSEAVYYPVDRQLSATLNSIAKKRGVSPETLLNVWLKEKVSAESGAK